MGGLSMNPDFDGDTRPKLAMEIAEKEQWGGTPAEVPDEQKEEEKPPPKIMKLGSFELDMSFPKTVPGIIRIVQVVVMLIAFICLLATPEWPDQGSYSFFCVFLIFGVLISGYLFFTIFADLRGSVCCGVSWTLLELVYFIIFGLIIFLGSCLAANKSTGPALTISAVFGFVAVVTYIYYIWITYKARKEQQKKEAEENEDSNEENEEKEGENEEKKRRSSISSMHKDNLAVENEIHSEHNSRRQSMNFARQNNSLPTNLNGQLYENQENYPKKGQRKRHNSGSDHDSAYSEGTITPTRGKASTKVRRTASAHEMDRDFDHVLQKQPLTHLSHRPYGARAEHDGRRNSHVKHHKRTGYGYPRELATDSFGNMGFNNDGSRFDDDSKSLKRQKSMPDWLRAALATDVGHSNDNLILDDESEVILPPVKRTSLLAGISPKEFPLLAHSDEESINYPSISQNGPGRQFYTMPAKPQEGFREGRKFGHHHRHRHGHSRRRKGHHHHHHHMKVGHHHHHRRMHHQRRHGHHRDGGRRPINDAHEDYLRRMVENDELVNKDGSGGKSMRGFQPHHGKPIDTGKRRVIPEEPISIQFPEHSRWDDDTVHRGIENPIMQKYLADAQKMRA